MTWQIQLIAIMASILGIVLTTGLSFIIGMHKTVHSSIKELTGKLGELSGQLAVLIERITNDKENTKEKFKEVAGELHEINLRLSKLESSHE